MTFLASLREWWRWRMRRHRVHIHGIAEYRNVGTIMARDGSYWWIQDEQHHAYCARAKTSVAGLKIGDCVEFQPSSTNQSWTIVRQVISIERSVEVVDGSLMLRILLSQGGAQLAPLARGIGEIKGEHLCVVIQPWLAGKLRIGDGSLVIVHDRNGKFTITRSAKNDKPAP